MIRLLSHCAPRPLRRRPLIVAEFVPLLIPGKIMTQRRAVLVCFALVGSLYIVAAAAAQDGANEGSDYQAVTAVDPAVPVDHLKVMLRPLVKEELEVEANTWQDLLRSKINEVAQLELEIKGLAEGESSEELTAKLLELRQEETALVQRTRTVLESLQTKGGDTEEAIQFIDAVSDINETTDATSYWAAVRAEFTTWLTSDDGGKLLVKRLLAALVILFICWLISRIAGNLTAKVLARHPRASNLLENFARRTTGGLVFVIGVLMALSVLGVEIGPMIAALGAGGFIVGFALQETLGSFASGMMIMIYRPFDVDDYVNVSGVEGTVKELSLVSTTLVTIDNKVLVIPNKMAWGDTIINFTGKNERRVDLVFGIGYDDDLQQAMEVLRQVAKEHELVFDEPDVAVEVGELADSSVNLICRPWVKTQDYWKVYWDLTREVKLRFDAEGISIPYPQRDVHVHNEAALAGPAK